MMRPKPRFFMPGSAWRMVWNEALRLIARIWSHFSGGKSSIGETNWMPALFTSTSIAPCSASIAATAKPVEHDVVADLGERTCDAVADAAGRACDHRYSLVTHVSYPHVGCA